MTTQGVDYLGTGPTPAELLANGKAFRLGYIGRPDSSLTRADIDAHHAAGIDVGLVVEFGSSRMGAGAPAGSVDGAKARAAASALGAPAGTVLWFCADWDVQPSQYDAVAAYLTAAWPQLPPYRSGLYGGLDIIAHVQPLHLADLYWQTSAWSHGIWAPGVALQQYANGQTLAGHSVDLDRALVEDFGQWRPPPMPVTAPSPDAPYLVDIAAGGTAYYDLASTQVAPPSPMAAVTGAITYGTGTRRDGKSMRAFGLASGFIGWVGADKCSNVRPKTPAVAGTVTITGQGLHVVGP